MRLNSTKATYHALIKSKNHGYGVGFINLVCLFITLIVLQQSEGNECFVKVNSATFFFQALNLVQFNTRWNLYAQAVIRLTCYNGVYKFFD